MKFDFEIIHRTGMKHQAADYSSRLSTSGSDRSNLKDTIPFTAVTGSDKQYFIRLHKDTRDSSHAEIKLFVGNVPWTLPELIEAQQEHIYCNQIIQYVGSPSNAFTYIKDGILVRKAQIDVVAQKVVPHCYTQDNSTLHTTSYLPAIQTNTRCMSP